MGMFARSTTTASKTVRKNDGLPIVQGRKVRTPNRRGNNNGNNSNTFKYDQQHSTVHKNRIWTFVVVVTVVLGTAYYAFDKNNNNNSPSSSTTVSTVSVAETVPAATATAPLPVVTAPAPVPAKAAVPAVPIPVPPVDISSKAATTFPAICTVEQRAMVGLQLPNSAACRSWWHSLCSFTAATTGCQNPVLARTFFSNTKDFTNTKKFNALLLGWNKNDIPIDMLSIGSGLNPKYKYVNTKNLCRTPIVAESGNTTPRTEVPQVLVIDWEPQRVAVSLAKLKIDGSYTDTEIIEEKIDIKKYVDTKAKYSLDKLILQKLPQDTPIHYVDIARSVDGLDYSFIMEMISSNIIKNVRFLHMEYNKSGKWGTPSHTLKSLIDNLRNNGLVCYWSGDDKTQYSLWRITDCFLEHYNYKHYARIQCVSAVHDDVKVLSQRMEKQFLDTLVKGPKHTFGDQP